MGLLEKLKLPTGREKVKLILESPETVRLDDEAAPLQLTIKNTSKDSIQLLTIQIVLNCHERATKKDAVKVEELCRVVVPFAQLIPAKLQAVVPVTIPIAPHAVELSPDAEIAQVTSKVLNALEVDGHFMGNKDQKWYTFVATVDVEGIARDPVVTNNVTVYTNSEFGGRTISIASKI